MRHVRFTVVTTIILYVTFASAAAGRSLQFSSQSYRETFRVFQIDTPSGPAARCQLTLEGSFHARTLAKVFGALVGYITRAVLGPCSTGKATLLIETLPWHEVYAAFNGTLPNISWAESRASSMQVRASEAFGITCLFRSSATEPLIRRRNMSAGVWVSSELSGTIRLGAECFGVAGTITTEGGTLTVLNGSSRITVTLI